MSVDSVKNNFERKLCLILCFLFCLPLFFINVKNSHDWGDDFAQYLLQAKNIVEKKPQIETGYLYNEALSVVAPPAYPAGFPLMLAPVFAWKGNSIKAFSYLVTSLLFLLCITLFIFLTRYFSGLSSLLLVFIFAYNPWTLGSKLEILSDIPFALFLLFATLMYLKSKNSIIQSLLTGIACGILISIRGVGLVFLTAFLLHNAYLFFKLIKTRKAVQSHAERFFVTVGAALAVFFLLNSVLVDVPAGKFLQFYASAYKDNAVGDVMVKNLNHYVAVFEAYFDPPVKKWSFVPFVSKSFALVLLLIGMLYSLLHKRSFIDLLTWSYILLFIFYPYSFGGFRFILPIFPFLVYYMVIGMKQIKINIPLNRKVLVLIGGLFVLLQYRPAVIKLIEERRVVLHGPQESSSKEVFQYIKENIPEHSIIVFTKPKALALYTNRKTFSTVYGQTAEDVNSMLNRLRAEYLLLNNDDDMHDQSLENYILKYPNSIQLIWKNDKFFLYKKS